MWDRRFLALAQLVASWSKDPSTQTGAVIVRPNKSVASVGFNGFASAMPDKEEYYNNREEKYARIIHCEVNALLFAREQVQGYTLYIWPFASCNRCAVQMIQAGITRFVFPTIPEDKKDRWAASFLETVKYLNESGIEYTEVNFD